MFARYRPPHQLHVGAVSEVERRTCSKLESILLEICHPHARYRSSSGALAHVLKFDTDTVFEAIVTAHMCDCLGVGVQVSAPYSHHMLGKAERPSRTI
jgi:hypothetical protein